MHKYLIPWLLLLIATGCSSIKIYVSESEDNLLIRARTDGNIKTSVDVYTLDTNCNSTFQGRITVVETTTKTGIPTGKPVYLVVTFSSSSFWTGESSMSNDMFLTPQKNHNYQFDLSYVDSIYNLELKEVNRKSGQSRIMASRPPTACKP